MNLTNPEKTAHQLAQEARHSLNEANSWLVVFVLWALAFCAGAFVEGQQFHIIFEPYYVNDDSEIVGAKFFGFWGTIIAAMAVTGFFIHATLNWLLVRAPATEEGIRALMGVLMAIAAVSTPFIIYAAFSANPVTGDGSGTSHAVLLLRAPLVLGAVLLMGIAVLGMKLALVMKSDQEKEKRKLTDSQAVIQEFDLASEQARTKPQRIKKMTKDLYMQIAEAVELARQVRGDYAIEHAKGKSFGPFAASVEEALGEALARFPEEIQRLVAAAMPPTIPYATLPATEDLSVADREALIEHGMAMKTYSTNRVFREMNKCA